MATRNFKQRRSTIISLVNEFGEVSVDELALGFNTSEVTIRKDLAALEKSGLLLRKFGGAVSLPKQVESEKEITELSQSKLAIAQAAANQIKDHNRIILDSGTTTAALIDNLSSKEGLVIMTNSLSIANAIHQLENEPTLLMTGGTWDPHSESFQGQVAETVLRSYDFDQLFIGADGIDVRRGTTTFNELIGLSRVMGEVSREVIVMAESDKIGRKIPNVELPWHMVDILITDDQIDEQAKQELATYNVRVICAS